MIRALRFHNYRVLRDAELPLQPFTLLVGPNGSGKSTVMHALSTLRSLATGRHPHVEPIASLGANSASVRLRVGWRESGKGTQFSAEPMGKESLVLLAGRSQVYSHTDVPALDFFRDLRIYLLDERAIIRPVNLAPKMSLAEDGGGLAGVLDRMRDESPESFEAFNREVGLLLPEFDRILFETPSGGHRAFMLRTTDSQQAIRAADLSRGTVLALAILTLAHVSDPPSMVCIEEPDRGIHPRLYHEIQAALYRLAYPQSYGLDRKPVQVFVTTHSPYLLDLYREHPEEVVIAHKNGMSATFQNLTDREDINELLSEASLGELWYSGVLGGVPVRP